METRQVPPLFRQRRTPDTRCVTHHCRLSNHLWEGMSVVAIRTTAANGGTTFFVGPSTINSSASLPIFLRYH